jgi:murein tripeptide amidase MpaA
MAGYLTSAAMKARLDTLATTYPALCTRSGPADWAAGWGGGLSGYVKVGATTAASPSPRWAVLITGGVHARELAPPDALMTFLEKMLAAYTASSAITYPAWTDPVSKIVYNSFTIPWPWVRRAVEYLDLYVVPLVNDDGRDFVLASGVPPADQQLHKMWRKNRRAAPSGLTDPKAVGIDVNRNFDILWNFPLHYDTSLSDLAMHASTNPVDENYIGDVTSGSAESEPEVKNVANLMRSKQVSYYLDVHLVGRDVLYPWGIESNQNATPAMNFTNASFDGKRDGISHAGYKEFIPKDMEAASAAAARHIADQILDKAGGSDPRGRARSTYKAIPSAQMYVASGTTADYCFSRWFAPVTGGAPTSPVMALVLEAGGDPRLGAAYNEGYFSPDYVKNYPKLEREIHVGAWTFLSMASATAFVQPVAP